jgi:hypothetical protein
MKTKLFILLSFLAINIFSQVKTTPKYSLVREAVVSGSQQYYIVETKTSNTADYSYQIQILDSSLKVKDGFNVELRPTKTMSDRTIVDFKVLGKNLFSKKCVFTITLKGTYSSSDYYLSYLVDIDGSIYSTYDSCDNVSLMGNNRDGFFLVTNNFKNYKCEFYPATFKGESDTLKTFLRVIQDTIFEVKHDTVYLTKTTIIQDDEPNVITSKESSKLLTAFPSPTNDFINIPYSITGSGDIKIYNTIGVLMNTYPIFETSNSVILYIKNLPSGKYYYFVFENKNEVNSGNFIKN